MDKYEYYLIKNAALKAKILALKAANMRLKENNLDPIIDEAMKRRKEKAKQKAKIKKNQKYMKMSKRKKAAS